ETLGDLERLVDDHGARSRRLVEKLEEREPEDVPVHDRHPGEPPVIRLPRDDRIQVVAVRESSGDETLREVPDGLGRFLQVRGSVEHLVRLRPGDVVLEEHLQGELPRLPPRAHQPVAGPRPRRRLLRFRFAIAIAASAASAPWPARCLAWSIVSQVRRPKPIGWPVSAERAASAPATAWPRTSWWDVSPRTIAPSAITASGRARSSAARAAAASS